MMGVDRPETPDDSRNITDDVSREASVDCTVVKVKV